MLAYYLLTGNGSSSIRKEIEEIREGLRNIEFENTVKEILEYSERK
jgi:hypothetical protein